MKRHGHLFEKVTDYGNLLAAAHRARRGKRDRVEVARFVFHLEPNLLKLQEELRSGSYEMRPYRAFTIREPKHRQICAAHFRDRVVHHAVCAVLDPIFETCLIGDTYACRRGKGTHAAVRRLQEFSRRLPYVLIVRHTSVLRNDRSRCAQGALSKKAQGQGALVPAGPYYRASDSGRKARQGRADRQPNEPILCQSVPRGIGPFRQRSPAVAGVRSLYGRYRRVR